MPVQTNPVPCACGCGRMTSGRVYSGSSEPTRYVHGHHRRGQTTPDETRRKLSEANKGQPRSPALLAAITGPRNLRWKGDAASVSAIHIWRNRHRPRMGVCQKCGRDDQRTDWHNFSETYPRYDDSDWIELCRSCHLLTKTRKHPCKGCGGHLANETPGCVSCYSRHYHRRKYGYK
jgi:hypothetical protein